MLLKQPNNCFYPCSWLSSVLTPLSSILKETGSQKRSLPSRRHLPPSPHPFLYTPHTSLLFIQLAVLAPLWGISTARSMLWPLTNLLCSQSLSAFFPHVPAGCQHLYTKFVFLNVSFVNGPKNFHPLAAIFFQLSETCLPPTTQMMYGHWTLPHMH